jgi:hypothetical protein
VVCALLGHMPYAANSQAEGREHLTLGVSAETSRDAIHHGLHTINRRRRFGERIAGKSVLCDVRSAARFVKAAVLEAIAAAWRVLGGALLGSALDAIAASRTSVGFNTWRFS